MSPSPRPRTAAVIGAQFGDEGKGKIVDALAPGYDLVVRYQGGNNAGHTLVVDGERTVLHLLPSGVLHPKLRVAIGAGCVVDPLVLVEEIEALDKRGIPVDGRLLLAGNAALVLPVHRRLDAAREAAAGRDRIGTTRRGIGPTYEDRAARISVLAQDLSSTDRLVSAIGRLLPRKNRELSALGEEDVSTEEMVEALRPAARRLAPRLADVSLEIHDLLASGGGALFEGAQGCLLDVSFGTVPFVTSSHTGLGAVSVGAGIPPGAIGRSVAVVKAYQTRVGGGPFPTELPPGELLDRLRETGGEYGATTGRPRRCGWLDLPLLRYAVALHGFSEIALTKLDVLCGFHPIRVCTGYRTASGVEKRFGAWRADLSEVEPIYVDLPGFTDDIGDCERLDDLPEAARALVRLLEQETEVPVRTVSVGPGRSQSFPGSAGA